MVSAELAEGESVLSGVWYGKGCPLLSRLGDPGKRRDSPAGSGAYPRPKRDFGVF